MEAHEAHDLIPSLQYELTVQQVKCILAAKRQENNESEEENHNVEDAESDDFEDNT